MVDSDWYTRSVTPIYKGMKLLAAWLDGTTMYRVVLYALTLISFAALTLSVAGVLAVTPLALVASFAAVLVGVAVGHSACVYVFKAPGNIESSFITGLILFLILTPESAPLPLLILAFIGAVAIALKYVVRYRLRHVFNPVALVLVLASLFGYLGAEWWVGSRYLLPIVLLAGTAVVIKTRRWPLVLTYVGVSLLTVIAVFWQPSPISELVVRHFISWPTIFFAAFMLTEPLSLPSTKRLQYAYAAVAAVLSSVPFHIGPVYGTPELALLVANLVTFVADKPARLRVTLLRKTDVGAATVEYTFASEQLVSFVPGQYMEWTLPHEKPDVRGIRRYFTIASAPGTKEVSFAVREVPQPSSWKQALSVMVPGDTLYAAQRAGDFTLDRTTEHRVFIAGGIGVTPFVSFVRSAVAAGEHLNATLFYCNKTESDIAYQDLFMAAGAVGVKLVHVLSDTAESELVHETGFITEAMLKRHVSEWASATYYISGPPGLVNAYRSLLRTMGVPRRRIVTDYFPGLA